MCQRTTVSQRREFHQRHQAGRSYAEIAIQMGVSPECVRYWCRRQRDGGDVYTRYQRVPRALLSRFDPRIRYGILRLRLEHPRWGANRLGSKLQTRPSLRGLRLPSATQIGRYLHQWPRFRRHRPTKLRGQRPAQPITVHQRWQLDFKVGIALDDGTLLTLHTVRDPVGEACLGAVVYPVGRVGQVPSKVTLAQARATLRRCFARWGTLPQEVQTDHETSLVGAQAGGFPALFTLWLKGLGIDHVLIRPGRPTDNAEVERCHRTVHEYAIVGNERLPLAALQAFLDEAVDELAFALPSRAQGCSQRPPVVAHPELQQPLRPFRPEQELACFDVQRVDTYLATCTWERIVSKKGQVYMGARRYTVGHSYAQRQVWVRFDPADRHFVFYDQERPEKEIRRLPALGLELPDLTGLATEDHHPGPQQWPLPAYWPISQLGVNC